MSHFTRSCATVEAPRAGGRGAAVEPRMDTQTQEAMTEGVPATGLPGLREAREAKLLTQQGLADLAGVGRTTIIDLESGMRNAHLRTIARLAAALGVPPKELLATATPVRRTRPDRPPRRLRTKTREQRGV
jgi:DNA-binding XRE family transcriptional regulator